MKIAVVGGGPVALWTASQIKIRNPDADIIVHEKHPFYQRTHPLVISHGSLSGIPQDARIQEVVQGFMATKPHGIFWKSSTISTKKIEEDLEALALKVGVKINKNSPIEDCSKLDAQIVIGADGAHSHVREKIFEEIGSLRKQLNHVVEVKYFVKGEGRKLSLLQKSKSSSLVEEHVAAQNEEGNTPITLRFFVTPAEYEVLQDATFKNPYRLDQLPASLKKKVQKRLALRGAKVAEVRVANSEKITAIPLGTYSASSFVKTADKIYCLVGDAAFGVPFFRSLNNGFLCGTKLAARISRGLAHPGKMSSELWYYNLYVHLLSKWEIAIANIKSLFIKIAEWIIYFVTLPWEILSSLYNRPTAVLT